MFYSNGSLLQLPKAGAADEAPPRCREDVRGGGCARSTCRGEGTGLWPPRVVRVRTNWEPHESKDVRRGGRPHRVMSQEMFEGKVDLMSRKMFEGEVDPVESEGLFGPNTLDARCLLSGFGAPIRDSNTMI